MDNTAMDDFTKAKTKAQFQGLFSALHWKNNDLLSLYEVTSIIKPKSETYLGMRTIPVSRIIGSEGRYHDFSSAFYPKREQLRTRWVSVDSAIINDVILPPISVYSLGGYFVSMNSETRGAFMSSRWTWPCSRYFGLYLSMKELRAKVVEYERNSFISQYKPSYLPMGDIVFTTPGSYAEMVNHILVHKYYINQTINHEISFEEAAKSWYANVYSPIVNEIRKEHLLSAFPGQSEGDMYMWLVRKWDEMKKKEGQDLSAAEAVKRASSAAGKNWSARLKRYIGYYLSKISKG